MTYETLLIEQHDAVTLVRLNRPQALNALNSQTLADLIAAFAAYDADPGQRCLVLTGSEKAFAAGADIKEMSEQSFADMYLAPDNGFAGPLRLRYKLRGFTMCMIRLATVCGLLLLATSAIAQDSTWSTIQHSILSSNCANCHQAGSSFATQSELVLTADVAYNQLSDVLPKNSAARDDGLLRVSSRAASRESQQSFLWEKINVPEQDHFYDDHPGYGAMMPLGCRR